MNFFKRAIASVTRRKGKSIILFAVVFILGNVIAGAISIQQATVSVEKNIKAKMGGTATVSEDYEKLEKYWKENDDKDPKYKRVTKKEIETIGNLSYVKYYDYSVSGWATTAKLKHYQPKTDNEDGMMMGDPSSKYKYQFDYKGVEYEKILDVEEKKIDLVDGRVFTADEVKEGKAVAVISKQMADENNLKVGDKLVVDAGTENYMANQEYAEGDSDAEAVEKEYFAQDQLFEIVGLFSPLKKEEGEKKKKDPYGEKAWQEMQLYNRIYTTNDNLIKIQREFDKGTMDKFPDMKDMYGDMTEKEISEMMETGVPYFVLKSPEDAEAFRSEATALLPDDYSKVILSTDQYDAIAGPVKNMSKIATYVIYVSVGATLLIISLVVLLFLRDRKHELGIYLSLGESRGKVIGQIVIEVVIISLVAITLSVFTGNILAKGVSGSLIETQMKAEEDNENGGVVYMGMDDLSDSDIDVEDVANSYEVSLSLGYIVIFYIVGIGTVLLSTVVPLIYILRLNPKKIMM